MRGRRAEEREIEREFVCLGVRMCAYIRVWMCRWERERARERESLKELLCVINQTMGPIDEH